MTIDEKRDIVAAHCEAHRSKGNFCIGCPLWEKLPHDASCFRDEEMIKAGYAILTDTYNDGDAVNHPSHYNQGKYECIDVMVETFGKEATKHFCLLNAFKYVWRTGEKNGAEDVKKAIWYLDKFLELEGAHD